MWRIVYTYYDGSTLKISGNQRKLPYRLAVKYQIEKTSPQNDGGMVYHTPFRTCKPEPLKRYIERIKQK